MVGLVEIWFYPPYELPLVTTKLSYPDHAQLLAKHKPKGAVLNLPVNLHSNQMREYLWLQSIHKRPIASHLRYSEYPKVAQRSPFLYQSQNFVQGQPVARESIDQLRQAGFGYVVTHSKFVTGESSQSTIWRKWLDESLGQGIAFSNGDVLYPLDPAERSALLQLAQDTFSAH